MLNFWRSSKKKVPLVDYEGHPPSNEPSNKSLKIYFSVIVGVLQIQSL